MMLLPVAFLTLVTATTLTSCTSCSSRGVGHYDTTLVDTMMAVNLDSICMGLLKRFFASNDTKCSKQKIADYKF